MKNKAAARRDHNMSEARRVRAKAEEYLNAGMILTSERTPSYYVQQARRANREAYMDARISRAWRGDRRSLDMPRIMYAYS